MEAIELQRIYRIKAMMHHFFSLYESKNTNFSLVNELLYKDGFEWLSPSGNLIGIEAFENSFNELNKEWGHSHRPFEMTVNLIDDKKASLSFNYIYQHVQDGNIVLHAKGHYEIECVDNGEKYPRIQKCNLTLLEMIEVGAFVDMLEMNKTLYLDYLLKAEQIIKI
ncbi:nuclear transport factor 2 family protein [Polaribacter sp. Q13]|uniref:nuclear transport factor 2 family protein n=1 Tax=Polaribacter sp. Q13 TaxID=2806551 RepID=UPI00193B5FA3|nr:nuclear transport factor 2 family protein [Polaribacter sp. Q13]QVY66955.1 nuclear transport factor 2 family protein [Polaribacter sp. Q13]